jgi:hypothetical protein
MCTTQKDLSTRASRRHALVILCRFCARRECPWHETGGAQITQLCAVLVVVRVSIVRGVPTALVVALVEQVPTKGPVLSESIVALLSMQPTAVY